jgi:glucose 1-dehydrogenase
VKLKGKVAVVTGAATGIGQAIAVAFANEGAAVVIDYVGSAPDAQNVVQAIEAAKGSAIAVEADISALGDVKRLVDKTVEAFQRVDILVNNAGIEKKFPLIDCPFEVWNRIIAVNLTGAFLCSQAAARQMIRQGGGGRIINISSIHEDLPMPGNGAYCASKGGMRMLMRTMAVELARHQITVNNIGPGAIFTPIDRDVESDAKLNSEILAEIPMGRWGKPEEVAQLAVYLASEDAGYVTGSTHFIDGGMLRNAGGL